MPLAAKSPALPRFAIIAAGVFGALLVMLAVTPFGPGGTPDSSVYVDAARHLAAGEGYYASGMHGESEPVTHWPPLFSAIMALAILLGVPPVGAGSLVNALAHGGTALLLGFGVWTCSRKPWAGVLTAWLLACSPSLLNASTQLLSEPLFILLCAGSASAFAAWLRTRHWGWITAAALLCGVACMQRYAGLALIVAGVVGVLVLLKEDWRVRMRWAWVYGALSVVMPVLLAARNVSASGRMGTRELLFEGPGLMHAQSGAFSLAVWIVPQAAPSFVKAAIALPVAALLLFGAAWGLRRLARNRLPLAASLALLHAGAYAALLAVTICVFDSGTPLDERLLAPLTVAVAVFVCALLRRRRKGLAVACWVALALLAATYLPRAIISMKEAQKGRLYSAPELRESELLAAVKQLPRDRPVASNWRDTIVYAQKRPSPAIPRADVLNLLDPKGPMPFPDPDAATVALGRKLRSQQGAVAIFRTGHYTETEMRRLSGLTGLTKVQEYEDGWLLTAP
ncbi:MAG: glycosyltransferase family 39 protein [Planctomycetes bacterium]|nr:glycosyltransferase family 39 protein [Planctomycetota bacterium]MCW8135760.1 glycosyltransferase family 39 protein [Planctomycetota bacterium]